jgi:hypothetical protein
MHYSRFAIGEIAKMTEIYHNAALTIAAAHSRNATTVILSSSVFESSYFKRYCFLRLTLDSISTESVEVSTFYG